MTDTIPAFPKIEARVDADATGSLAINGLEQTLAGGDEQALRSEILELVTATANEMGRPVRMRTRDPFGEQLLAVFPDGHVEVLVGAPCEFVEYPTLRICGVG